MNRDQFSETLHRLNWTTLAAVLTAWMAACLFPVAAQAQVSRPAPASAPMRAALPLPARIAQPPQPNPLIAWWIWYGVAANKPEVQRELTLMHRAGLGGVLIYPEYPQHVDDPAMGIKNLRFLSPAYLDVYRYAAETAHRLGMTFDVNGGTGWPYGGPSVTPYYAAQKIALQTTTLAAAPTRVYDPKPNQTLLAVVVERTAGSKHAQMDVTKQVGADGMLSLPGEAGATVLTFYSAPTGMKVKRPAVGGEGYIIDHLSADSLRQYEASTLGKLLDGAPRGTIRALFVDSLEVYGSDWTHDFPAQFLKRRGYDLRPWYPALFDNADPNSGNVRVDYWNTVGDLFSQEFVKNLQQFAHQHGAQLEVQAYGVPAVPQRSYQWVDLPGGEQYDWKNFTEGRWGSSAAHFYGRKRVLAEYATWAGIPNRFTDTLDDLKLVADLQFLSGMTELGTSTLPYSPPSAGVPGWQDYAGAAFGLNQSWEPFFPDLTTYLHRASTVLETGKPVADVLLYLPVEDVEAATAPGTLHTVFQVRIKLAQWKQDIPEFGLHNALNPAYQTPLLSAILDHGYSFDGISGDILAGRALIHGSRLNIGDGSYRVVVLPRLTGMRLDALQKIASFVRAGGCAIAVGRLPDRVYGGLHAAKDSEQLRSLVQQMFPGSDQAYGRGHTFVVPNDAALGAALKKAVPPDLSVTPGDGSVGFIHRHRAAAGENSDLYFVVNTSARAIDVQAAFRVSHRQPQLWDLARGVRFQPAAYRFAGDRTVLQLHLAPRQSLVVAFGRKQAEAPMMTTDLPEVWQTHGHLLAQVWQRGRYVAHTRRGEVVRTVPPLPQPVAVDGPWRLAFAHPLDQSVILPRLQSWTAIPAAKYFSGMGTYTTSIDVSAGMLGAGRGVMLDLGDVRNAARVWVNGHPAGDAWQAPFRLDITPWLHAGRNTLKVSVANLLLNTLLGQKPPDYSKLIAKYGDRFPYPEDWKVNAGPLPSGLLGPVRLVPFATLDFSTSRQHAAK